MVDGNQQENHANFVNGSKNIEIHFQVRTDLLAVSVEDRNLSHSWNEK